MSATKKEFYRLKNIENKLAELYDETKETLQILKDEYNYSKRKHKGLDYYGTYPLSMLKNLAISINDSICRCRTALSGIRDYQAVIEKDIAHIEKEYLKRHDVVL